MGLHMKEEKKGDTKVEKEANEGRVYEVGYLLVPTIGEEEVPAAYGNLRELILNNGGEVIADEMPKMIPLAYQMQKVVQNIRSRFDSAYFGWIKFEMDPLNVLDLKKKLEADTNIIRFLITKTVRENTLATKKFVGKDMIRKKYPTVKKDNEDVVEIDKEEIDKEIEALVAV